MKELTIISGKGGTGKTSILGAFATLAGNSVICDCDVDAANLHILLRPEIKETHPFYGEKKADILPLLCTQCGLCQDLCRFQAIKEFQVNLYACEGCALCQHVCPVGAVVLHDHLSGHWYVSETQWGPMVHAKLGIAQGNSGLLVNVVRKKARELAKEKKLSLLLSDGPPGIGCPVISSLAGTDMALIVTEPTASGIHDLARIAKVAGTFGCQRAVCINKYNLDETNCQRIEDLAGQMGIPVLGKIPFDPNVTEAVLKGIPVTLLESSEAVSSIRNLWEQVVNMLGV
ncbi:ATP-binding protein [Desulforamulus hydrothermalis]|uniref:Cobyrinic acid ac-diamide synthase n=1 Tax=Desulforamulus hydrothermalis Lam5 = DSM 18033 TaxID=1121428 RepID=K8DXN5_9FIRM|nr:ATP-binding protein [Desulforamulus hydrothermalis]CCO07452.1 Cobyrinic acid ac-diamide synthase [Desulforamulus hydrothermalis Lam5 = DSM 18033]SHH18187.1 MinD superfamily P-loop ATPase, contains an inserted ferredoxin domain [Desulforamulus hydrothermalis Lam5 = DSM 18033]